jgi:hypothetical protein
MSSLLVFYKVYRLGDTVSHVGIFDPSCELMPLYLLSDLPPPPSKSKRTECIYRQCVAVGGGGESGGC